jgi:hypothetical protein
MCVAIEKINRRLPLAVIVLVFCYTLHNQGRTVQQLKLIIHAKNLEANYTEQLFRCASTREIGNGNETVVQYLRMGSDLSLQENEERDEFVGNNGVNYDAKSMNGIDSAHMAKDGSWIENLPDMLKCDQMPKTIDGEYTYTRIPTKETWYVSFEVVKRYFW